MGGRTKSRATPASADGSVAKIVFVRFQHYFSPGENQTPITHPGRQWKPVFRLFGVLEHILGPKTDDLA
jgi:hypothetical protein